MVKVCYGGGTMQTRSPHLMGRLWDGPKLPSAGLAPTPPAAATRFEVKYLLPDGCLQQLRRDLSQFLHHDQHATISAGGQYKVRSLYFDTPNNRAYHEKIDGINCRSKVRIRRYFTRDAMWSDWFLEIKSKYHNACVKAHRLAFSDALLADHLLRHGSIRLNELVDEIGKRLSPGNQPAIWSLPLEPKLLVVYDREPLVDPRQARFRLTFDMNIQARLTSNPYEEVGWADRLALPVIMEVKFERGIPAWLAVLIRKYDLRMESTSKYAQGKDAASWSLGVPRTGAVASGALASSALRYLMAS